jgi:hypothetical protein
MKNLFIVCLLLCSFCSRKTAVPTGDQGSKDHPVQYIIVNGIEPTSQSFEEIVGAFGPNSDRRAIKIGAGFIISYLNMTPDAAVDRLKKFLSLSVQYNVPIVIQLDGEQWWEARPDLWNWWDANMPGYDQENRKNVEWTGWVPDSAVKIGWRNWGRQIRVLPMPNLMSPVYRDACHKEMDRLVPIIADWWTALPEGKKDLLAAVKVGWESAIGVNNWYYPNGNALLDQPESGDPQYGLKPGILPDRGVEAIGYAATKTLGLADSGPLKEAYLTEVVRRHLEDLSKHVADGGVPRERIFTHCGGWSAGESLYSAAVNKYSCPGWSFYQYASDPAQDTTAMQALAKSDAPCWAAVEWLLQGERSAQEWEAAIRHTLADHHARFMNIYNWSGIKGIPAAIQAIGVVLGK